MIREIEIDLKRWNNSRKRKPLLLRGARQVGKTYIVRKLGRNFDSFIEVNFEENKNVGNLFHESLNPQAICERLSAFYEKDIVPGKTLLFFDEIQACPDAISSLRFFYEKMPELHLIAAGSLLEFVMEELPSMGVGRITSLFMFPMSFYEFLHASGEDRLLSQIKTVKKTQPINDVFHRKLLERYKIFQLIGGMPEVVDSYINERNLNKCIKILDDLLITFRDDFAKYKAKAPVARLEEVFDSVAFQAGGKFKFSNVNAHISSNLIKDALSLLEKAGLVYRIHHTSANGIPLKAEINAKKFKIIPLDTGLHQRMMGLNITDYISMDDFEIINKGSMAEIFVGLEILKNSGFDKFNELFYWHRESRGSNAEIDYIIQDGSEIIPIEVKSGKTGHLKSLHLFISEHGLKKGIKISLDNYSESDNICSCPLYATAELVRRN